MEVVAVAALVLGIVNSLGLVVCLRELAAARESRTSRGLPVRTPIPPFSAPRPDGTIFDSAQTRGHVLLFVSTDCSPCHELADALRSAPRERLPPLVVAVAAHEVVDRADPFFAALSFVDSTMIFVDDHRQVFQKLAVPGTPFAYAIDSEGLVRGREAPLSANDLRKLRPLLA